MVVVCHYCEEVYPDDVDSLNKKCDKCGNFIQPIERNRARAKISAKEWRKKNPEHEKFYNKFIRGENIQKLTRKARRL